MQSRISLKWVWLVVTIFVGIAFWLATFIPIRVTEISETSLKADTLGVSSPMRLKIPKIGVDALVENVGLTKEGTMDAPKGPENVGWLYIGPRPGQSGASVIDGHSGWKDDIPAVFDELHKLEIGDKIYIEDANGVNSFIVQERRIYDPKADVRNVFFSNDGKARLNLITCTGVWDDKKKEPLRETCSLCGKRSLIKSSYQFIKIMTVCIRMATFIKI